MSARINGARRSIRTAFQTFVGLCAIAPVVVAATGLRADQVAWLAPVLVVAAAVSKVMADPRIEEFLQRNAKWLAARDPEPPLG